MDRLWETIKAYWSLIKPRQTFLLTFIGVCSMLRADPAVDFFKFFIVLVSLVLSIAGATALTNYVDRDIDGVMERTRRRPLPSNEIDPPSKALYFGTWLVVASLIFSLTLNLVFTLFLVWGFLNSVVVYNFLTKRRTPLNIVLASPTGAAPVLGGWVAVRHLSLEPVLMAALVVIWIPIHVWSIVLKWREDYAKAGVPMLPLLLKWGDKLLAYLSIVLVFFSLLMALTLHLAPSFLYGLLILNAILLILSLGLAVKPTPEKAWLLFKFTSPYVAVVFILWFVSSAVSTWLLVRLC